MLASPVLSSPMQDSHLLTSTMLILQDCASITNAGIICHHHACTACAAITNKDVTCATVSNAGITCADITNGSIIRAAITNACITCAAITCASITTAELKLKG